VSPDKVKRITFEEVQKLDAVRRDFMIIDRVNDVQESLVKGHHTMDGLRRDVDAACEKLDEHCEDPDAHHKAPSVSPSKIAEHKYKIASVIVATASAVILYMIGS
jgi:hypothetical protein